MVPGLPSCSGWREAAPQAGPTLFHPLLMVFPPCKLPSLTAARRWQGMEPAVEMLQGEALVDGDALTRLKSSELPELRSGSICGAVCYAPTLATRGPRAIHFRPENPWTVCRGAASHPRARGVERRHTVVWCQVMAEGQSVCGAECCTSPNNVICHV